MAKTLETTHISPSTDSSKSLSEFSLPLTCFDIYWLKFPPVESLFFYSLPHPKETLLKTTVPKLKHSLSLALKHFLPLAGTLTWLQDSPKPVIRYTPKDGVSLTIAEGDSADDFDLLSSNHVREATLFHPFCPKLKVIEAEVSVIALQINLFPNKGFCIGVTSHHAVSDGKSISMFLNSWAYLCRSETLALPGGLTPFLDRSVIEDLDGLDMFYFNQWLELVGISSPKDYPNLLLISPASELSSDLVRATFELTKADMINLKEKVLSKLEKLEPRLTKPHLTSFVLAFAYTLVCLLKAREGDEELCHKKVLFSFAADLRSRLRPPVPANYFGNCVGIVSNRDDLRAILNEEDSLTAATVKIGERINEFEMEFMDGSLQNLPSSIPRMLEDTHFIGVAGSPRLGFYDSDFGWGKPKKVEIVSVDRTGAIAMMESRDGSGGIEIVLVLKKHQMDVFASLFLAGVDQTVENSKRCEL